MKLKNTFVAAALAVAASASFADTFASNLDLTAGNAFFGRNDASGSFVDTYSFTLLNTSFLVSATASSAASGDQDLDYTSLLIKNSSDVTVATFAGNLGTDANEFYALSQTLLAPGSYKLVISGLNSPTQASYSGNLAVSVAAVPEPETYALMLAGLGAMGFVARRRKAS